MRLRQAKRRLPKKALQAAGRRSAQYHKHSLFQSYPAPFNLRGQGLLCAGGRESGNGVTL